MKTNLLFFTKGRPTEKIWYYDLSDIKVGKKTPFTVDRFEEFFRLLPTRGDSDRSWTVTREAVEATGRRRDVVLGQAGGAANHALDRQREFLRGHQFESS